MVFSGNTTANLSSYNKTLARPKSGWIFDIQQEEVIILLYVL